jgi:drug/metabolite transporter (DMT)-like permease
MLVSGVLLTSNDALSKLLVEQLSVGQLIFLHSSTALCLLVIIGAVRGELRSIQVSSWRRQVLRGACYVAGTFAFITSLRYLELADAVAIAFASPVFVAALAPRWLGEKATPAHWIAISLGFVGMLVMLRPGFGMHWAMLLPLIVAIVDAVRDLLTRKITATDSTLSILLVTMAMVVAVSAPFAAVAWKPLTMEVAGLLFGTALVFVGAHIFMVEAFRHGETVAVTPFRYLQLVWSVLAGFAIWGDAPDLLLIAGTALTAVSGLVILRQESRNLRSLQRY